uniref:hypothetical protein n=1 Tax=Streptomyces hawaiiensis TaxID=67305 RepID=UPI0031D0D018
MVGTTQTGTTVAEVTAEQARPEDPKARAVNERKGDDHGPHLAVRAVRINEMVRRQQS